ncbi:MAG: pseudouridine synthase [Sphaerobacter thermophilus]|uniref:pseudouridine synthase n=1 Tax=Sphaerobacter thermophilus TaxID=2057 RepID=UPI000DB4F41E|nr:MAG: rRNA pseudouridine synthase [Sphaerobacter thermophilus]
MERLQRVLAAHGVASRRKAEELITAGRVTVDGQVVRELGVRVDPERQEIRVDGKRLRPERRRYIMLNKPPGYITTVSDERGRRTVMDLVQVPERVVPAGRLDRPTAGLLLLTNDGDLLFRITHPRYELEKEYEVLVDGHPPPEVLDQLRRGVTVDGERVVPDQVRPLRIEEAGTVLRIVIHEGRNRIVRRMMDRVGYPVLKLTRTRIGPIHVRGVPLGAWRDLTPGEVTQLLEAVGLDPASAGRPLPEPGRRSDPGERRGEPRRSGPTRRGERPAPSGARPPARRGERRGGPGTGPRERFGRGRGGERGARRPPGRRDRRPGGGRQDHRGERGGPPA